MNKKIVKLLYRSFDAPLKKHEKEKLEKALSKSAKLRKEKERIENIRKSVPQIAGSSFSPFFSSKVMREINTLDENVFYLASTMEWFTSLFKKIAIAGAVGIIALIIYNVSDVSQISVSKIFGVPEVTVEEIIEPVFTLEMGEY